MINAAPARMRGARPLVRTESAVTMSNPNALLLSAALFPHFTRAIDAAFDRDLDLLGVTYRGSRRRTCLRRQPKGPAGTRADEIADLFETDTAAEAEGDLTEESAFLVPAAT